MCARTSRPLLLQYVTTLEHSLPVDDPVYQLSIFYPEVSPRRRRMIQQPAVDLCGLATSATTDPAHRRRSAFRQLPLYTLYLS